jgi:tetratricopeptide (TPR) repeat protein
MNAIPVVRILILVASTLVVSACQTTSGSESLALGNEYAKQGLLREAIDQYRKSLAIEPANPAANRNLGIMLVKTGDYRNAIKHLEAASEKIPADFDTNYYLGEACRAEGRYGDAIYRYQQSLRIRPNETRALKALAWSFYKIRYYAEALNNSQKLMAADGKDVQASAITARILVKLRRFEEALNIVQSAMKKADKETMPFLRSIEGDVYLATGNPGKAAESYGSALREAPLTASALYGMARIVNQNGQKDKSADFLERAIRVRPEMAEAHYLLGEVLEASDPAKSRKHFEIFSRLAATDPDLLGELEQARNKLRTAKK